MTRRQKVPLRPLTDQERRELERLSRAQAEPVAIVARAKALLAVAGGQSFTDAARSAGRLSGDAGGTWLLGSIGKCWQASNSGTAGASPNATRRPSRSDTRKQVPGGKRAGHQMACLGSVPTLSGVSCTMPGSPGTGIAAGARLGRRSVSARAGRSPSSIPMLPPKNLDRGGVYPGRAAGVHRRRSRSYQTIPYPGSHWHPAGHPVRYPHEYAREGTAKQLTLFHPATGQVRVKGVRNCPNAVLHPWLKAELTAILATLPEPEVLSRDENRRRWERWQEGRTIRITLPQDLPPLRLLLVWDNLTGHSTVDLILWLFDHGIMPLLTPLGGSYLSMAGSVQRILKRRALDGQHPKTPGQIIDWLEAAASGWNREPTPFVCGGKRKARRDRARERRHALGGSGAYTRRPLTRSHAA